LIHFYKSYSLRKVEKMAGKPTSIAAILQEGLPKKTPAPGIPTRNRFSVLKDRSVSAASGRSDFCSDSQKRIRVESPEAVDRNQAFRSMADEEEKFKIARNLVEKVKEGVKDAKDKGMEGPIWAILQNISEWMDVTTGVQETTANVVVDSFNKVASPLRKSRRDSPGRRGKPEMSEEEAAIVAKKKKFGQEVKEAERCTLIFAHGGHPHHEPRDHEEEVHGERDREGGVGGGQGGRSPVAGGCGTT
jgi:hypothetical protein